MKSPTQLILLTFTAGIAVVLSFPSGAPDSGASNQCDQMTPAHGATPQTSALPYGVKCKEDNKGQVKVVIKAPEGGDSGFRGLLVQVRDGSGNRIGTINAAGSIYQNVCANQAGTHRGRNIKGRARFVFDIPVADRSKDLTCFVTVVQDFSTYWVQQKFPVIRQTNRLS